MENNYFYAFCETQTQQICSDIIAMKNFLAEKIIMLAERQPVSALSYMSVEISHVLFLFYVKSYQGACKLAEAKKAKLLTLLVVIPLIIS